MKYKLLVGNKESTMVRYLKLWGIVSLSSFFVISFSSQAQASQVEVLFDDSYLVSVNTTGKKYKELKELKIVQSNKNKGANTIHTTIKPIMFMGDFDETKNKSAKNNTKKSSQYKINTSSQDEKKISWFSFSPSRSLNINNKIIKTSHKISLATLQAAWTKAYKQIMSDKSEFKSELKKNIISLEDLNIIEPNVTLIDRNKENYIKLLVAKDQKASTNNNEFKVVLKPSKAWAPKIDDETYEPDWHMNDKYSQLKSARGKLKSAIIKKMVLYDDKGHLDDSKRVLIAHLDTGFYKKDAMLLHNPANNPNSKFGKFSIEDSKNFFDNKCVKDPDIPIEDIKNGECPGHGAETLSVLHGGDYKININGKEYTGVMGANPYANVVEYRIKDGVLHFKTKEMSDAINHAVEAGVDVISLSGGGLPSAIQRDAVNYAYDHGIAIFAATGDFFKVPPNIPSFGIKKTPSITGFPASYNRVMAVAGTTYDFKSYSEDPYSASDGSSRHPGDKQTWLSWMLRGNVGPYSVMNNAQAVSAYSPNIFKSESLKAAAGQMDNNVALDGAGTSSSTPQVAAAASIWLQMERKKIEDKGLWRTWEKAEAVYHAISICSADKTNEDTLGEIKFTTYFGAGHLKADDALQYHFPDDPSKLKRRLKSSFSYSWYYHAILSMITNKSNNSMKTKNTKNTDEINRVVATMMQLEALQFSAVDEELANLKKKVDVCLYKAKDGGINSCSDEANELVNELKSYKYVSKEFKSAIKVLNKETIDAAVHKEITEAIKNKPLKLEIEKTVQTKEETFLTKIKTYLTKIKTFLTKEKAARIECGLDKHKGVSL